MTESKRKIWIDVYKGILIICVVLGHEIDATRFVYWFHMPLFFAISGYFIKVSPNIVEWFKSKICRIMVPYFFFFIFITLIGLNDRFSLKQIVKLLYGGRMNTGVVGVWWYPTCFLLTLLIVQLLIKYFDKKKQLLISIIMYAIGMAEWYFLLPKDVNNYGVLHKLPWNIDVCLCATLFMIMGYYCKTITDRIIQKRFVEKISVFCGAVFVIVLLILSFNIKVASFNVDMKYAQYGNPVLFLVFPILFGVVLLLISDAISNLKFLNTAISTLGYHSMSIMYLHVPILYLLRSIVEGDTIVQQVFRAIVALLLSYIISIIFNHFSLTRILFLSGDISKLKDFLRGKNGTK